MTTTRRELLIGAGIVISSVALAPLAYSGGRVVELAVFDSRMPHSVAFSQEARKLGVTTLDVAFQDQQLWRDIRAFALLTGDVIGVTRWSDYVLVRGFFEEHGKRVSHESKLQQDLLGLTPGFQWYMV